MVDGLHTESMVLYSVFEEAIMPGKKSTVGETAVKYAAVAKPSIKRKNIDMDQHKLDRAKALLGARTETEAVDMALGEVLFWADISALTAEVKTAGGIDDVFGAGLSAIEPSRRKGRRRA